MKTNAIIRIVIFSLIILGLLGVLVTGLGLGSLIARFTSHVTESEETFISGSNNQVSPDGIRNLNIEWVSGSITVQPGDTDRITFSESGNFSENDQMVWRQSGDTLIIQFSKAKISLGIEFNFSKDLIITVPRNWTCKELNINSVSAEINVTDLTAEEIELENVSGNCTLENCTVDNLSVDTVSGNVQYRGTLNILECSSVSASCTLTTDGIPKDLSLESVSGDLILELPESCGFSAELDTLSGRIYSEFGTSVSKNHLSYGDGSCRITADTTSGDIIIRKS